MRCHDSRTAISARLDGEEPGCPDSELRAHLQSCEGCRAFAAGAEELHRSVRLNPAVPMPDLTPTILHAIGEDVGRDLDQGTGAAERALGLRICLALIGVLQIAIAIPALILGDDAGLPVHTAHHIGSFTAALAVGFLFVAWRPERASGLLPVATALVAFVIGTTVVDVITGRTAAFGETGHVTEIVGVLITWMLTRPELLGRSTRGQRGADVSMLRPRTRGPAVRLAAAALVALAFIGITAGTASAHAVLESSTPSATAQLARSPHAVVLRFGEAVEASLGAIRLYDAVGNRVDVGSPKHPGGKGSAVSASVPNLGKGSYVVTWRVVSADSHPVRGAFTFTVGKGAASAKVEGLASRLLTQQGGDAIVGALYAVGRFGIFTGIVLLVGATAFLLLVWPEGRASARAARGSSGVGGSSRSSPRSSPSRSRARTRRHSRSPMRSNRASGPTSWTPATGTSPRSVSCSCSSHSR